MNRDPITQLGQMINSYGWQFSLSPQNELLVRFLGEISNTEFHLIIGADEQWVSMTVWPYLISFPADQSEKALELLCKRNFQLRWARLGMTDRGETSLCLDLPLEGLSESLFHAGLDVISYYADRLYPDFVSFWSKE